MKKYLSAFAIILHIFSYATHAAPNDSIINGVYTTAIGLPSQDLGTFSIFVPQSKYFRTLNVLEIKESKEDESTMLFFGPKFLQKNEFLGAFFVLVQSSNQVSVDDFYKNNASDWIKDSFKNPTALAFNKIYEKKTTIDGLPALYTVYREILPMYVDSDRNSFVINTFGAYFILYPNFEVRLVSVAPNWGKEPVMDSLVMINEIWLPQQDFVQSFTLFEK